MSWSAQPGAPGYGGGSHAPRPNRTPYFVVIGVLAITLIAVLVWAIWPTNGRHSSNASTKPTPSTTDTQSEPPPGPDPTPTPSAVAPTTQQPPTDNPIGSNQIAEWYATLNEVLPKKLENWELDFGEIGGTRVPVYRDDRRLISFSALGGVPNPEEMFESEQELQQFDGGCCYLSPRSTQDERTITCLMELKAAPGLTFKTTSSDADIDEMVRLTKALIAIEK